MTAFRDDAELEGALRDLARHLELPPTPALASQVRQRLLTPAPRRRRLSLAALALAVLIVLGVLGVPPVRTAVARWFGIPGVLVQRGTPPPVRLGHDLDLGKQVSLAAARAAFPLLLPMQASLGPPDEVYRASVPGSPRITVLYRARPGLPRAVTTGTGALLTEFRAQPDRVLLEKVLGMNTGFQEVRIGKSAGYWLSGQPHYLFFRGRNGQVFTDTVRLAGNTLLWTQDGITLRLESALNERRVVALAESVRPWNR